MQILNEYLKEIHKIINKGDSREESFYSTLEKLLKDYGNNIGKKIDVTTIPKKTEAGNPDFRIWDGKSKIIGYIEAKHPDIKSLDEIEKSEQVQRYLEAFPNFILTNFLEFRLYRNGSLWDKPISISSYDISKTKNIVAKNTEDLINLLDLFISFSTPSINSNKELAEILAYKAGLMRDFVVFPKVIENKDNYFYWLYDSFKNNLIEDLKEEAFADLFSQTFTYGLFISKYYFETQENKDSTLPFTTTTAYDFIQKSFGLLREIFKVISTQDMPKELRIITDDVVDILNSTNTSKLLNLEEKSGKKDPVFHLYETFLARYDKEKKKKLGIYYTPPEVVSFIIRSVNELLKDKNLFGAPYGLASTNINGNPITLLDPAVGTGTFLVNAIQLAIDEIKSNISTSSSYINDFIKNHILKDFYAFEILMAPYVVSHLKVLFTLTNEGYKFSDSDTLNIYLTNTLKFHQKQVKGFPGLFEKILVSEQQNAYEVKNKTPILIVVGNPPYSVSSQNKIEADTEFGKFYETYKENVRKEEKNIQPLSDDYIKFLAFSHYKINKTGEGIVAMITNNSFLDGIIHRDMRKKLLDDFDLIYILNLHGDIKRAKGDKNIKDENVFDITQGVSINIFVKTDNKKAGKKIFYSELIGPRNDKYDILKSKNVNSIDWCELNPEKPYYFFTNKDFKNEETYSKATPFKEIFQINSSGIKTHRDHFVLDNNISDLENRIKNFITSDPNPKYLEDKFGIKDNPQWKILEAKRKLVEEGFENELIREYYYHPFDKRFIYYSKFLVDRPREKVLTNFLKENLGIILMRKTVKSSEWKHVLVSDSLVDINFYGFQSYIFPLYVYNTDNKKVQNETLLKEEINRTSNIKKEVINELLARYKQPIGPEDIFNYIYAVLYSNIYRGKYNEFLKIDFPKIPFTSDFNLFSMLSSLGSKLIDIHILKSDVINKTNSKFEGDGDGYIKYVKYDKENKRIYINETQYFTNIEPEIYNYYIGSYQVLNKWLKDRKGDFLYSAKINHFIKVIKAIEETIKVQKEIDKLYPEIEKNIIEFN